MTGEAPATEGQPKTRTIGFWQCWAFSVGTMIGSGIFMMPAVLAPRGGLSFGGWLLTAGGSIMIALVIGRLASRTMRSGGMMAYARDAFGPLAGFLVGWAYWTGCWISTASIAVAFVGYLTVLAPGLTNQPIYQIIAALAVIWTLTLVSIRGVRDAGFVQLLLTLLKLAPLALIVGLGLFTGRAENLPEINPAHGSPIAILSATALLTMYAFLGLECGAIPAGNVRNPGRTLPRAVVFGTITVAAIYVAATAAVMLLVPAEVLAKSTSPFAEAARGFGAWGPVFVTAGALVSAVGAMNGNIFVTGQVPMAAAIDGLAPKLFARLNKAGAPVIALVFGSALSSVLLISSYSRGLVGAFTFLLMVTTLTTLGPYLVCALAELKHSWRRARSWAVVALAATLYAVFAVFGSGIEVVGWSLVLSLVGLPVYILGRRKMAGATAAA